MDQNPFLSLLLAAAGLYLGKLWLDDLRAAGRGRPNPRAFPGATPARRTAILVAVLGALALLALETWGETALGLSSQQSHLTWLFAGYSLTAAIIEEIVFRGYLVIEGRGPAALWGGIVAASVLFAAAHPFLWKWDAGLVLTLNAKGAFSTAVVFAMSLWMYACRFAPWNPSRSLLPCIAGHAAKNAGVIAIKAAQGFMGGLW